MPHGGAVVGVLVVYLVVMLAIGIWAERRSKTKEDFILGGKSLGPWLAGLSYAASTSSAWVMLGFTAFVFVKGLSALWIVPGVWVGYTLVWLWAGPKLQAESRSHGHLTLIDFLTANSKGPMRGAIAALAAALIVISFSFFIAGQMRGAGQSFDAALGVGLTTGVLIGAGVVLFYMFFGGFWAASLTDTIQGAVMAIVGVILPTAAVMAAGGPGAVWAALAEQQASGQLPEGFFDWTGGAAPLILAGTIIGLFSAGFGSLGQPHLLNWLMALKDDRVRVQGFLITLSWGVIIYIGMAALALAARALVIEAAPEQIFFAVAQELLPPVLAGLTVAAVLAAIMSTVDSQLLVASAAISHDMKLGDRFPKQELLITRLVMIGICAAAVVLTFYLPEAIFTRVLFAWAALGAAFGPIVAVRVFGVEPQPWAIFAAMFSGFALTVVFYLQPDTPGDIAERTLPWLPSLLLLLIFRQRKVPAAAAQAAE
jgi:sodium/proline symporter